MSDTTHVYIHIHIYDYIHIYSYIYIYIYIHRYIIHLYTYMPSIYNGGGGGGRLVLLAVILFHEAEGAGRREITLYIALPKYRVIHSDYSYRF